MKELNIRGEKDRSKFDYLDSNYKTQDEIVRVYKEKLANQNEALAKCQRDLAKQCVEGHIKLLEKMPEMMIAIRSEFGNDENAEAFAFALNRHAERMRKTLHEQIDSIIA